MIKVEYFYEELKNNKIDFFTGVPDSLLKSFCAFLKDNIKDDNNIVAANEGNAIALAVGHYLATKNIGLVYMQNSGIGNAVNPLISLADEMVYNIPLLLLIGWRGEPNIKDEPQHKKQGLITTQLLETMGIKYKIIDSNTTKEEMSNYLKEAYKYMIENGKVYAIVVKKNTFEEYRKQEDINNIYKMTREEAIEIIVDNLSDKSIVVSTTGMASRELFEVREKRKESHEKDFLTVGSMGHCSQIALGIALAKKSLKVYCLDGDGALLMHLGGMAIIGEKSPKNYIHLLINNGAHDSVGGQETVGYNIDMVNISKALNYNKYFSCSNKEELIEVLNSINSLEGPIFIEIKVKKGARKDLGRPTKSPIDNKKSFMEYIENV